MSPLACESCGVILNQHEEEEHGNVCSQCAITLYGSAVVAGSGLDSEDDPDYYLIDPPDEYPEELQF